MFTDRLAGGRLGSRGVDMPETDSEERKRHLIAAKRAGEQLIAEIGFIEDRYERTYAKGEVESALGYVEKMLDECD